MVFILIFAWIFSGWLQIWQKPAIPPEIEKVKASPDPDKKIEQQINIIDQVITSGGTDKGIVLISTGNYTGATYYFEVVAKVDSGSGSATLTYNAGTGQVPEGGSTIAISNITATSYTRYRSTNFSPTGSQNAYVSSLSGTGISVKAARIIILQSDPNLITKTETQIEVGNNANTTATTYTDLTDKKIYYYDSAKFNPTPAASGAAYFEATIKNDNIATSSLTVGPSNCGAAANVDNAGGNAWGSTANACGSNDSRASVSVAGTADTDYLKATTFGFNITAGSTINGIEATVERSSSATQGKRADDALIYIVKGDVIQTSGNNKAAAGDWPTVAGEAAATYGGATDLWGVSWTSSDINNSGFGVAVSAKEDGGKSVTAYIDNVTMKVYYTTPSGVATTSVQLWNKTDGTAVTDSEISAATTSWSRIRSGDISANLTTGKEYVVQIKISDTSATARIANAKIILDQSNVGGIDKLEMVHQYVNTRINVMETSWTNANFDNAYGYTNSWDGGNFDYYFEATMRGDGGVVFADLWSAAGQIASSEISTSTASYTRIRSSNTLSMPNSATTTDTRVHTTCSGNITYGGETYGLVEIGTQCWLKKNLNIAPASADNSSCSGGTKYCYGDNPANCDIYGGLYNWAHAMCGSSSCNGTGGEQPACSTPVQGLCPTGWHLPSHYEVTYLERQICSDLGNSNCTVFPYDTSSTGNFGTNEASAMSANAALWTNGALENDSAFGASGLDLLPAGEYSTYLGNRAYMWSSTESGTGAWTRVIRYDRTDSPRYAWAKTDKLSVRCIRD